MIKFVGNVGTDKVLPSLCAVTLKNFWHIVLVASGCFHADAFDSCTWSEVKHSDWERCLRELQTQAKVYFCNVWLPGRSLFLFLKYVFGQYNSPTISMLLKEDIFSDFQLPEHSASSWLLSGNKCCYPPWKLLLIPDGKVFPSITTVGSMMISLLRPCDPVTSRWPPPPSSFSIISLSWRSRKTSCHSPLSRRYLGRVRL